MQFYSEQELYAGNRGGYPLDPVLKALSERLIYGDPNANKKQTPTQIQQPLEIEGANRSRLTSQGRKRRARNQQRRGKRALTTGLNTGAVAGGKQGGISF